MALALNGPQLFGDDAVSFGFRMLLLKSDEFSSVF
jgi:hypothetical protein